VAVRGVSHPVLQSLGASGGSEGSVTPCAAVVGPVVAVRGVSHPVLQSLGASGGSEGSVTPCAAVVGPVVAVRGVLYPALQSLGASGVVAALLHPSDGHPLHCTLALFSFHRDPDTVW
jgi:hypothetical protein